MPIGVPKVPFRSPREEDASWVCDLSDILGHMGFPRFLPNRDILCFAHERLIES